MMRTIVLLVTLFWVQTSTLDARQHSTSSFQQTVQELIQTEVQNDSTLAGIIVHVEAPKQGVSLSQSAGVRYWDGPELNPKAPVRIASNTKTYTAAAILRLYEQGLLKLDDSIEEYISKGHLQLLKSDGYHTERITIRHLLTHTSGMVDHAATQTYLSKVFDDPNFRWTRSMQIKGAVDWGDPLFEIGQGFSYSDTGYLLLGEIIEKITGKSLGEAFHQLLKFDELGIQSTWQESIQDTPSQALPRAHQYFNELDTYNFDPSLDLYGGGGLAATAADMALFYQALFNHRVFDDTSTLELMIKSVPLPENAERSMDYRMGIYTFEVAGEQVYAHAGFWGTQVVYVPSLNASVAVVTTQFGKSKTIFELTSALITELKSLR
jgi:D-alanyl-D-alanine carboxypeptidase